MRHAIRIAVFWVIASVIADLLVGVLPIPSPTGSAEARGAHQTVYMLFYVGAPVFVFVWVLFLYSVIVFRRRPAEEVDPAPRPDSQPILLLWAGLSFVIVLFLAGWGTFTLHEITSAPDVAVAQGQNASTRHTPAGTLSQPGTVPSGLTYSSAHPLTVQAIGQEWYWTFRYPTFGGMETSDLVLPVNTPVYFSITSLDVVHSLWIYDYGIKEDAVPGVANHAWLYAHDTGATTAGGKDLVKCNELCGIWHGYMHSNLRIISPAAFQSWARNKEAAERANGLLKVLPKYSEIYYPSSNANWPPPPQDQSP